MISYFISYCSVDDGFPVVTLHFEKSLSLKVQPHDYFFQNDVSMIYATLSLLLMDTVLSFYDVISFYFIECLLLGTTIFS